MKLSEKDHKKATKIADENRTFTITRKEAALKAIEAERKRVVKIIKGIDPLAFTDYAEDCPSLLKAIKDGF